VSGDGNMNIWNMETGECELTVLVGNTTLYKVIQLNDGRLVASDTSRLVYIIGV
jgi:hypothetical protein